jgi:hypothetical protein
MGSDIDEDEHHEEETVDPRGGWIKNRAKRGLKFADAKWSDMASDEERDDRPPDRPDVDVCVCI